MYNEFSLFFQNNIKPTEEKGITSEEKEALKNDFATFFNAIASSCLTEQFENNWHITLICKTLDQFMTEQKQILIINIPPGFLKTTILTIFSAWLLGRDGKLRIMSASQTEEQSKKIHSLFCRAMESHIFKQTFPECKIKTNPNTSTQTHLVAGGYRHSVSFGQSILGLNADIILIDDPNKDGNSEKELKNDNQVFEASLSTRLREAEGKQTKIILVMQRLHELDLSGYLLATRGSNYCKYLKLPIRAIENEEFVAKDFSYKRKRGELLFKSRFNEAFVKRIEYTKGSVVFETLYQQNPFVLDGEIFKRSYFQNKLTKDEFLQQYCPNNSFIRVLSIDTASSVENTSDYTVLVSFIVSQRKYFFLEGFTRAKLTYPQLRELFFCKVKEQSPNYCLIENSNIGTALIQELINVPSKSRLRIMPLNPKKGKKERAIQALFVFETGLFFINNDIDKDKINVFIDEFVRFPRGSHDDLVDATSQTINNTKITRD